MSRKTTSQNQPKAYSYVRFSTPEQSKGDSKRRQTDMAMAYARANGLTLDTELSLLDLGVSAFRGSNLGATGALGAFMTAISDGIVQPGSVLLIEAMDRLSRDTVDEAVDVLKAIVRKGVDVVTLNDGKRYTKESLKGFDFVIAAMIMVEANRSSAEKGRRLKAAWDGKRLRAAAGGKDKISTATVPAWIKVTGSAAKDSRNAKLTLIPERAQLVRRMFKMFLSGEGKHRIAETFNAEKIATFGRAGYWHNTYIFKILTSPTVTGRLVPHIYSHADGKMTRTPQAPIPDYYPRVIDDETFQRAQGLFASRRGTVRSAHAASIVAGLARCPKCGGTMTRITKGSGTKAGIPKLICVRAKSGAGCDSARVRLPAVEKALIDAAATLGDPPAPDEDLTDSIRGVSGSITELKAYIEALADQIELKPSAALSERLARREAQLDKTRENLKALEQRAADSSSNVVKHRAARLRDCLRRLKTHPDEIAAANSALRECVESVTIDYPNGQLILKWRHGVTSTLMYSWPED